MSQKGLMEQDLSKLDVTKLHPLSPEVISRQATINIVAGTKSRVYSFQPSGAPYMHQHVQYVQQLSLSPLRPTVFSNIVFDASGNAVQHINQIFARIVKSMSFINLIVKPSVK
ncbi:uncharacterized protein LOC127813545 [Diospyros lotus]|uniref:uncharacterized protein LOC127813545 n=1 Tax=Diospyros lotus TaxID=55363 RepID=UPI0022568B2A|nr:uncharacterized protein LOC127813545 [Diospyros lotus]